MIQPSQVRDNVVVTVARGVPEKNLELFWEVAKRFPSHEFVLLLTRDPRFVEYSMALECTAPANGRVIVNPDKEMYQETLSRSKIYLHLMRGEHFGITVVESMSAGCVPVVHDSGGPKGIVGSSRASSRIGSGPKPCISLALLVKGRLIPSRVPTLSVVRSRLIKDLSLISLGVSRRTLTLRLT